MPFSQKQLFIIGGIIVLLLVFLFLVLYGGRSTTTLPPVSLTMWGFESPRLMQDQIIKAYNQIRPNVKIQYTQVGETNYHDELLNALARGEGPDILVIGNRDLPRDKDKLTPALPTQINLVKMRELYPTVVEQDFVRGGQIYALPLHLDTMALLYNRDLFDQAGIVVPPKTWDDFEAAVPALRALSPTGQIVRAAAAIGGSESTVDAGMDLVELLMLQLGVKMTDPGFTTATFAGEESGKAGLTAFQFYLQFANAVSPYYTWNESQPNSLDSFAAGKTAIVFNYASALAVLKEKGPFLHVAAASMPQPSGSYTAVSYPRYLGLTVSKQSKAAGWAWDFIVWLTTNPENEKVYLNAVGLPPALRSLVAEKESDPDIGVFARQALTARSWYEADDAKIRDFFNAAIQSVLQGRSDAATALRGVQDQVSTLMRK